MFNMFSCINLSVTFTLKKLIVTCLILGLIGCGAKGYEPTLNKEVTSTLESNEQETSETTEVVDIEGKFNGFNTVKKHYVKSNEDISNPGRGFYQHLETRVSPYSHLNKSELIVNRDNYQSSNANYTTKSTIILRAIILDEFITTETLSPEFLTNINADFTTAREAGIKMVLRFYYHKNSTPPYGDPEKEIILAHIKQLKPLLTNNADVILAVQQGFIGAWGEQYYSDKFSPQGSVTASYTKQNWLDRSEVLAALLDATASTTMVQVRTPQAKQKYIYGAETSIKSGAAGSKSSLTAALSFIDHDIARIGFHNDCFLTDESDTGTYSDYGTNGSIREGNAATILKNYHKNDSQFVIVGGETCADESWATPPVAYDNNCSDDVVKRMDEFNFSYLNADYNNSVNNDWAEGDNTCIEEIKNKLGYRFSIKEATLVTSANAGNYIPILITIENDGFTSPVTPMELRLVLKNQSSSATTTVVFDRTSNDIRKWQPGITEVGAYFKLADDLDVGDYSLFLHLADVSNDGVIADRPEYSIQLANVQMWDENSGHNALGHTLSVGAFVEGDEKNDVPVLVAGDETKTPAAINISIDGDATDWESIPTIASAVNQQAKSLQVASDEMYLYFAISGTDMGPYFDLFINVDGDVSTGFQSLDWVVSGADYLLERGGNGLVVLLKSSGTGWNWTKQAVNTIEENATSSFIELKIEKSDFEALSSSISLGVNDVVATGWTTQSRLPLSGEVMATYTM